VKTRMAVTAGAALAPLDPPLSSQMPGQIGFAPNLPEPWQLLARNLQHPGSRCEPPEEATSAKTMLQVIAKRRKAQGEPSPWSMPFEESTGVGQQMEFLFCVLHRDVWGV